MNFHPVKRNLILSLIQLISGLINLIYNSNFSHNLKNKKLIIIKKGINFIVKKSKIKIDIKRKIINNFKKMQLIIISNFCIIKLIIIF